MPDLCKTDLLWGLRLLRFSNKIKFFIINIIMDYITLYLIMATVFLLFINSLLDISNITDYKSSVDSEKSSEKPEIASCVAEKSLSVGTNSAAILGITLFLLFNFEIAIAYEWSFDFFEFFALNEVSASRPEVNLTLSNFCQSSSSYRYFSKLALILTFIVTLSVKPYILKENILLVLLSTVGILLMASSTNFISFYLALELISLASYVLVSTTIKEVDVNLNSNGSDNKKTLLVHADNSIVAGLNYFLLSALSSGLLVLGISLIYYTTGELDFNSLARIFKLEPSYLVSETINGNSFNTALYSSYFTQSDQPYLGSGIGMCLVICFVLFKLGASPFHYWVADVYEKVSIFVNYFLIVIAKLGMLFALMKLSFAITLPLVENLLIVASVCSLLIGSFAGLVQTKVRRLMAFSSINHVGYILLATSFSFTKKEFFGVSEHQLVAMGEHSFEQGKNLVLDQTSMIITEFSKLSIASLWLYITIYILSTVSFFAILSLAVENGKHDDHSTALNLSTNLTLQKLNTFAILNVKAQMLPISNPRKKEMGEKPYLTSILTMPESHLTPSPVFITASLTITLLSLAGVPPLAGFIAKVAIFWQVLDSGNWFLATVAVLCSVIAAIYYLRIVALLYFNVALPATKLKSAISVDFDAASTASVNSSFSTTYLTALIISTITVLIVVFPILNPSFMYLYMING